MNNILEIYQYVFGGDLASVLFTILAIFFCWVMSYKNILTIRIGLVTYESLCILIILFVAGLFSKGMMASFLSSLLFIAINVYMIYRYYKERDINIIPKPYQKLYQQIFYLLTPYEFMLLLGIADKKVVKGRIITNREKLTCVYILMEGAVLVTPDNNKEIRVEDINFFGEVSVISEREASASVDALGEVTLLEISRDELQKLSIKDPSFKDNLYRGFALAVKNKIIAINNYNKDQV